MMKAKDWPRLVLTAFIMVLLGFAAWNHYSPGIEETIKAIVLIAVGYWMGSSEGSKEKTELMADRPSGREGDEVHVKDEDHV